MAPLPFYIPILHILRYFSIPLDKAALINWDKSAVECVWPFKYPNSSFSYPSLYFRSRNPFPFIYLQPEKRTPFGWTLHV